MAGGDRIRLFCALRLPEPALDALVRWQDEHLRGVEGEGVRVVPRANLHVTLAFLGSRPSGDVPAIAASLAAAAAGAEPRVGMVVLADVTGTATALADDVQSRLEREGLYRREQRDWLPHVTVLRFRERPRLGPPTDGLTNVCPSDAAVMVSVLGPGGARYEARETAAFSNSRALGGR